MSQPQATRALGISVLEDRIVQKMMHRLLESIYEPLFLESSYAFRPDRGALTAIQALHQHLFRSHVETVIDVDLAGYFDTVDHQLLAGVLGEKIQDERFMPYLGCSKPECWPKASCRSVRRACPGQYLQPDPG